MKRGRPKLAQGEAKDKSLVVRLTEKERELLERAASAKKQPSSDFLRSLLSGVVVKQGTVKETSDGRCCYSSGDKIQLQVVGKLTQREWRILSVVVEMLKPDE